MTARQPRAKGSPSIVVQLVGLVALIGTLWASIQTTMPLIIEPLVKREFANLEKRLQQHGDTLIANMRDTIRVEIQRTVKKATEDMGLIAMEQEGKVVYSPRIVVQADTMGLRLVNLRLDTMAQRWRALSVVRFERTNPSPASKGDIQKQKIR